jgi:hypothetical protein
MDIFISWSGDRSKAVAELLKQWVKQVLQGTQPWISTQDIGSGGLWLSKLSDKLKETGVGIVCLAQDNKTAPWILFEAGALAKGLSKNRVCTFLIDLKPEDIGNPLGQFNHTVPTKESLLKLVQTLNQGLTGPGRLEESTLRTIFEVFWPKFEREFADVLARHLPKEEAKTRTPESYLVEILENTRSLNQRIATLESRARGDVERGLSRMLLRRVAAHEPSVEKREALMREVDQVMDSPTVEGFNVSRWAGIDRENELPAEPKSKTEER